MKILISTILFFFVLQINAQGFLSRNYISSAKGLVKLADMDNDGDVDFVRVTSNDPATIVVSYNDGNGNFSNPTTLPNNNFYGIPRAMELVDINGDNNLDILLFVDNVDAIYWVRNLGGGNFATRQLIVSGYSGVGQLVFHDMDNDGIKDILFPTAFQAYVPWIKNFGNGSFGTATGFGTPAFPLKIYPNDIDNDGDLDLYLCGTNDTYVMNKQVNGTYSYATIISTTEIFSYSVAYDYDGDGDDDLVGNTYYSPKQTFWIENQGNFNFSAANLIPSLDGMGISTAIDFNLDNQMDFLVRNPVNNSLGWFENNLGNYTYNYIDSNIVNMNGVYSLVADIAGLSNQEVVAGIDNNAYWFHNIISNPTVSGSIYWDENMNKVKDGNEVTLMHAQTLIQPSNLQLYSDFNGDYTYTLNAGNYVLSYDSLPNWQLNSDSGSYSISVSGGNIFTDLDFGLIPTDSIVDIAHGLSSGILRCHSNVEFHSWTRNTGTTILDGTIWLQEDTILPFSSFVIPPDTTIGTNTFGWHFENLYPGQIFQKNYFVAIPGVNVINPGDSLHINQTVVINNNDTIGSHLYSFLLRCSYDPNDKITSPDREGIENYTLHNELITYTIRFQNTGNDTAFNVIIEDSLDQNLDWNSFQFLSSSHMEVIQTEIVQGQYVKFSFNNIMLPDSNVNFNGSQGYVSYSVLPKTGLADSTIIENTGFIYFDFNPPIITNTTVNTLVTLLPCDTSYSHTVNLIACDSIELNNNWYFSSQTITETMTSSLGCDSIIYYNISINLSSIIIVHDSIEIGESYILPDGSSVSQTGSYTSSFLDFNNCDSSIVTELFVNEQVGLIDKIDNGIIWEIYPNPANSKISIAFYGEIKNLQIEIYDALGRTQYSSFIGQSSKLIEINTEVWNSGIYNILIINNNDRVINSKKVVITK